VLGKLAEEKCKLKEELDEANLKLQQQETETGGKAIESGADLRFLK
jgi:hypothetical protein